MQVVWFMVKRLLEILNELGEETAVVVTDPAKIILEYELGIGEDEIKKLASEYYSPKGPYIFYKQWII